MLSTGKLYTLLTLFSLNLEAYEIKPRYKVAMVMFDNFEILDLFGPAEVFGRMPDTFKMHVVAKNDTTGVVGGTIKFKSEMTLEQALKEPEPFDMIVVPGGSGVDFVSKDEDYLSFLRKSSEKASLVFTICTGSLLLAASGVLDGKKATTNKIEYWPRTPNFPNVKWQPKARWVEDGKFVTTSGVSAGTDGAFHIVSQVKGQKVAKWHAKFIEYSPVWDPSNDPFALRKGQPFPDYPKEEPATCRKLQNALSTPTNNAFQQVSNQTPSCAISE